MCFLLRAGRDLSGYVAVCRGRAGLAAALRGASVLLVVEKRTWKEFAVVQFVEPGAFDVEQFDASEAGERQGVHRQLRDGRSPRAFGL